MISKIDKRWLRVLGAVLFTIHCSLFTASAQTQTVTGQVIDENGEPVIGASVTLASDKSKGTVTDFDGNYTLSVPKNEKVTITYIGYMPQTVKPGGKTQLQVDSQSLEEVVVVGYGTQKKAHLTGSVANVEMDDIQDLANGSLASSWRECPYHHPRRELPG